MPLPHISTPVLFRQIVRSCTLLDPKTDPIPPIPGTRFVSQRALCHLAQFVEAKSPLRHTIPQQCGHTSLTECQSNQAFRAARSTWCATISLMQRNCPLSAMRARCPALPQRRTPSNSPRVSPTRSARSMTVIGNGKPAEAATIRGQIHGITFRRKNSEANPPLS